MRQLHIKNWPYVTKVSVGANGKLKMVKVPQKYGWADSALNGKRMSKGRTQFEVSNRYHASYAVLSYVDMIQLHKWLTMYLLKTAENIRINGNMKIEVTGKNLIIFVNNAQIELSRGQVRSLMQWVELRFDDYSHEEVKA